MEHEELKRKKKCGQNHGDSADMPIFLHVCFFVPQSARLLIVYIIFHVTIHTWKTHTRKWLLAPCKQAGQIHSVTHL